MPGMAPISLQQFMNATTGRPYSGARALFYEANSNDPITTYANYALSSEHPNPVIADNYGRFPVIFISEAVEFYRLRVTTASGSALPLGEDGQFDIPVLPVIGPAPAAEEDDDQEIDENALLQTGDAIWTPKAGTRSGFVRMNARTIGSASSGASERANADCADLYAYIWNNFSNSICPVSGGRGSTAASDFAANKPIATIDMRSRAPFGIDSMGNSATNRFASVTFATGDGETGGSAGGTSMHTLTVGQTPAHDHDLTDPGHTHLFQNEGSDTPMDIKTVSTPDTGNVINYATANADDDFLIKTATTGITLASVGSGEAHPNMPPFVLGTWLWKL